MRLILPLMAVLTSCSAIEGQKPEAPDNLASASAQVDRSTYQASEDNAVAGRGSVGAIVADLPYLAIRKVSGPALQALMVGRLEVQGDCVVFVEPGAAPKLAVFHPPAALSRDADGTLAVVSGNFRIPVGREVRVGGGTLPTGENLSATLEKPVADRCPGLAVEIGEFVR